MKRVLITGASGFIGGWLVEEALQRGYEVWAGVREGSSRKRLGNPALHFINIDYEAPLSNLTASLQLSVNEPPFHYVIHNAGVTKTLNCNDFYRVNFQYVKNLAEALTGLNCPPEKFLLMSSLSVYGPVKEGRDEMITAGDTPHPNTHYGNSKLMAERFLQQQTALPYLILQPTGVYGPGDRDYLLQIQSIQHGIDLQVGFKPQKLTFIYVKDLAAAAFQALEKENLPNAKIILSDGAVYSPDDFTRIVKTLSAKRLVLTVKIPLWLCRLVCFCSERYGRLIKQPQTLNSDKFHILRQRNWSCDAEPL